MNNKGFTLIELLATIALLSIISIISFVSINAVLDQSKVNNCESLIMNITSASKEYISDNRYSYDNVAPVSITLQTLISNNYLISPVIDPFSDKEIDPNKINITITLNRNFSANTITILANGTDIDCTNKSIFSNSLQ